MATEPLLNWNIDRIIRETFVSAVDVYDTLPSTNDEAMRLAGDPAVSTHRLILADRQTQGRGRGKNVWWSSSGSLTFSLLLGVEAARLPTSRWPEMSLTVGSSVCAAVAGLLPAEDVRLKWPNDVYLRERKLCGVLVEIPSTTRGRAVVGIGINVSNSIERAPVEVQQRAIALCDVGATLSKEDLLIAILREFERQMNLLTDDPAAIQRCWRQFDLLAGRSVTIADGLTELTGTCLGIDDDGALLLRTEAGTHRCFGGVVQSFA